MALICWVMSLLDLVFLSWRLDRFYQRHLLHLLRWQYVFVLLVAVHLFVCVLIWFWCQCDAGLIEHVWKNSFPFSCHNNLSTSYLFLTLVEGSGEANWSWAYVWWERFLFLIQACYLLFICLDLLFLHHSSWKKMLASRNLSIYSGLSNLLVWSFYNNL